MTDIIKNRRSVRKYADKKLEREVLCEALCAARFVPSWKNSQSVRYYVTDSREMLSRLGGLYPEGEKNGNTIRNAAALIAVVSENGVSGCDEWGEFLTPRGSHWQSFDAGIAAQTLCLALFERGVASGIIGHFEEEGVRAVLEIPEGFSISALISAGYASEELPVPPKKDFSELVHFID